MSTGRKGPLDWAELQERMREFYAYAFLPPSYTNDDFGEEDTEPEPVDGPQKPPTEPRVVTNSAEAADSDSPVGTVRQYARQYRDRADEFYTYAFLPPSYTNDDFGEEDAEPEPVDGPQKPPAEARVVADPESDDPSVADEALAVAREYAIVSRDRANAFYEHAFLPPSYTNDDFDAGTSSEADVEIGPEDFDGFVFTDWLDAARPTGPQKPPARARVVTDAEVATGESIDRDRRFEFVEWLESDDVAVEPATQPTPEPTVDERDFGEFAFVDWLDSGDSEFEPIGITDESVEPAEEPVTPEPETPTAPRFGIKPHPAKAATYALFLAVLTLAVLSVVGYAPVLGPATGLGG